MRCALLLACMGAHAAAQVDADAPPAKPALPQDLQQLIDAVEAAHRGPDAPKDVRSFRAEVRVEPRQGNRVAFDLRVDFQLPKAIRYEVMEEGERKERGFDPERGPWVRTGDIVTIVEGRDHNIEREQVLREIRLARQLLAFLDPRALLGRLQQPEPVTETELRIGRLRYPGCAKVSGRLDSFPTYGLGTDGPAAVTFYIGDDKRLLAVLATPLDGEGRPATASELMTLGDYALSQDLWLPTRLNVYREVGDERTPETTILIRRLRLAEEFADDHFDRPN